MMDVTGEERERLERERRNADRRYNEALTALDAALVRIAALTPASIAPPSPPPPDVPSGWRGPVIRAVRDWLGPSFDAQHAFNAQVAAAIASIGSREQERAAMFERFQQALIVFLQQITAFVETKDRQLSDAAASRADAHQAVLDTLPDLRSQVAVLQRATHMLTRKVGEGAAPAEAVAVGAAPVTLASADDHKYVGFEDQFRGSVDDIRDRLTPYLPIFADASNVLDIGCGRGEFLLLLKSNGISARGVDVNTEMIAETRERGLDAEAGDALTYLRALPDESLGGIFAAQVVEHLKPSYLVQLLEVSFQKMRPGAPLVFETINPTCWLAFFSSYLRDITHAQPIHPETLEYLTRASGFANVSIRYSAPVAEHTRLKQIDLPAEILNSTDQTARAIVDAARVVNVNAGILNNLAFSYQDYAVTGYRS
jgi:SAM-dependent methyltransferase